MTMELQHGALGEWFNIHKNRRGRDQRRDMQYLLGKEIDVEGRVVVVPAIVAGFGT
jgi:hypothetical protein